jgi:hypothetical protein
MSKEGGADGLANMLADLAGLCAEDVAETAHRQADNKARRRFLERGSVFLGSESDRLDKVYFNVSGWDQF